MPKTSKPGFIFAPRQFGAQYEWIDQQTIKIVDGISAGQILFLKRNESAEHYQIGFFDNQIEAGHCYAEFEKNSTITVWDVVLERPYQRKGLSEMMVRLLTKELLSRQKRTRFQIRMLQLFKPEEAVIQLQNVGMGVIAYKLGLTCEFDFRSFMENANINYIEVIAPTQTIGPAYKINLNCFPYTLVAFMIDIDKERPVNDFDAYIKFRAHNELMLDLAKNRALIIGNATYLLKDNGIIDFVNRLADNEDEAKLIYRKIQGVK